MTETAVSETPNGNGTGAEFRRRRRARNWALFAVLLGFVVLIYVVSIVRMGGGTP